MTSMSRSMRCSLGLVLVVLTLCASCSTERMAEPDEVAVYATVLTHVYEEMMPAVGGKPGALYVLRTTDDGQGDPAIERQASRRLAERVQSELSTRLENTALFWVDGSEDVPLDPETGIVADGGMIVTVGNVHTGDGGKRLVPVETYLANLGGSGQTLILEQNGGVWTVVGNTGVLWES